MSSDQPDMSQANTGRDSSPPQPLPPFSCTFSPNIPELLQQMNASIAITTYQAGKLIMISPKNRDELVQLPRNFEKPMGLSFRDNKLAVATRHEITILANNASLAKDYPRQSGVYDSFFVPRVSYHTGEVDLHDLEWTENGLVAVNTRCSCLCRPGMDFSFTPLWNPPFISGLDPEDRCHLNGLAIEDGKPRYVTMLARSDSPQGWRENRANGGILMDVVSNEVILEGLSMPHSPRIYNSELYLLLSGTGDLVKVNVKEKSYQVLKSLSGFARGMDRYGDYLFIGLSKLRTTSKAFQDLPVSNKSVFAGVVIIYLPTASNVGYIKYETSVDEIFDVAVIPETQRPGLLNTIKPEHKLAVTYPGGSYWVPSAEQQ